MKAVLFGASPARFEKKIKVDDQDLVIGVDGGVQTALSLGLKPDFIVGDWDSLKKKKLQKRFKSVSLSTKKDRSDLFFAAFAAVQAGATELICYGVTGGRPDHHLATLAELSAFSTGLYGRLTRVEAHGTEASYVFLSKRIPVWKAELSVGQLVSVFAWNGKVQGLNLFGFRYPLKNYTLASSSQGLSNEVKKRKCEVYLRTGQLVVIMPRDGRV